MIAVPLGDGIKSVNPALGRANFMIGGICPVMLLNDQTSVGQKAVRPETQSMMEGCSEQNLQSVHSVDA